MIKTERELKDEFEADYKVEPDSLTKAFFDDDILSKYRTVCGADKPKQYDIGIDTFTRMRANATFEEAMGFIRWNIDKYNTRKKGQDKSDYAKIIDYCNEALWWIEKEDKE